MVRDVGFDVVMCLVRKRQSHLDSIDSDRVKIVR